MVALTGEPARFQNRAAQWHRWYEGYAFRYGQPENKQVAVFFHDITERKRAMDSLEDSEQRLTDIVEFLPDATFAIDRTSHRLEQGDGGLDRRSRRGCLG